MSDENQEYTKDYSDDAFWGKIKTYAKKAGKGVLEPALKMYFALKDSDTPLWAKSTIVGAFLKDIHLRFYRLKFLMQLPCC